MDNVRDMLRETAGRYGKDIVIVETAYPWTNEQWWSKQKNMTWPVSPEGQRRFMSELIETVRATPANHGVGVVYWHPESVPLPGTDARTWNGGAMALFDREANALP